MNDNLKGTLFSAGGSSSVIGTSAGTLSLADEIGTSIIEAGGSSANSVANGGSSVASTYDLSESEMSKNTTILGIIGATLGGTTITPVKEIIIDTKNNVEYDLLEKRANKIYDKYHKKHIPSDKRGKGFIFADNPDTAYICNEMFYKTFGSQESLIVNIKALLSVISDIIDNEMLSVEYKELLQKTKMVLIELNAAYTEKKVITLSTKDDEVLAFILDNFKKHQENNKSKIRTLSERKKIIC